MNVLRRPEAKKKEKKKKTLLDLPDELLQEILGHLRHLPSFLAARLVCRRVCMVSYPVITNLNIYLDLPNFGRHRPGVLKQIATLSCLTRVALHGRVLDKSHLLVSTGFAELLRHLHICPTNCTSKKAKKKEKVFCAHLADATNLTSLVWGFFNDGGGLLPLLVQCPRLVSLDVETDQALPSAFCNVVCGLTGLCTLSICHQQDIWLDLLPLLTDLPYLRDLSKCQL